LTLCRQRFLTFPVGSSTTPIDEALTLMFTARVRTTARFTLLFIFLLLGGSLSAIASSHPRESGVTRVACVGDSITFGDRIANRDRDSSPAQLGRLLGAQWEVRNFGVSGATMMNAGNLPYMKLPQYREALNYNPDVLVIALGTNDSKPFNIDAHPEGFMPSYEEMIAEFRNPRVRIFVYLPPPAFAVNFHIREGAITGTIIPQIRSIASKCWNHDAPLAWAK
jgi:lysophospholipase L1-like esterase